MIKKIIIFISLMIFLSASAYADTAQMKITLVKIVNQLQAVKILINTAKSEQSKNPREKIHFDSWLDAEGNIHNGVRQDINTIQAALVNAINKNSSDPKYYQPIKDDFIGKGNV